MFIFQSNVFITHEFVSFQGITATTTVIRTVITTTTVIPTAVLTITIPTAAVITITTAILITDSVAEEDTKCENV